MTYEKRWAFPAEYEVVDMGMAVPATLHRVAPFGLNGFSVRIRTKAVDAEVILPLGDSRMSSDVVAFTTPDPTVCCILLLGASYLIHTEGEMSVVDLETYAVSAGVQMLDQRLLVLVDYTHLVLIGPGGLDHSGSLSDDQMELLNRTGSVLRLRTYSAADGCYQIVSYDVVQRRVVGVQRSVKVD